MRSGPGGPLCPPHGPTTSERGTGVLLWPGHKAAYTISRISERSQDNWGPFRPQLNSTCGAN
jgi:hypothetical protein